MKIISKQENLIKGLNKVSHLTGKNYNLPILNNILFKIEKGNIELSATNLEMGVKTNIRGKIEEDGCITVPARIITDYINLIDNDKNITLEIKENDLLISSSSWQTKIKTNPAEDYPLIPDVQEKNNIKIKLSDFKDVVSSVLFAASFDETRPELSGILFWFKDSKLTLAATDSYRLAEKTINIDKSLKEDEKIIIPLKTMQELVRIIGDENDGDIILNFEENQVKFSFKETNIVSRLTEGEYPDYKQIIPNTFNIETEVNKQEIIKAIKAASLFTKVGIFDITLNFSNQGLVIKAVNAQLGENVIKLNLDNYKGSEVAVVFNYKYLLDGFNNISSSKVKILINSASNPVVFKPISDIDYLYLVMPIRQ